LEQCFDQRRCYRILKIKINRLLQLKQAIFLRKINRKDIDF